jgi:hypothetical protein
MTVHAGVQTARLHFPNFNPAIDSARCQQSPIVIPSKERELLRGEKGSAELSRSQVEYSHNRAAHFEPSQPRAVGTEADQVELAKNAESLEISTRVQFPNG